MTDTEKAALERRIYDRCLVRVGQLEAEKAVLERRIDELCAEVEKYRSARDASVDLATKTIDRIRELEAEVEHGKAENAKLRELVQYILDEGYGDDWFGKKAEELGFKANY